MNSLGGWTLLAQVASTLAMVGLIWFVQVVHYPLFARVGASEFTVYEQEHQRRTTWVVAPLMLTELATAVLLLWYRPPGISQTSVICGLVLLAILWAVTYTVQVPQHAVLQQHFSPQLQRSLVTGNWIRTVVWTLRGLLVLTMMAFASAAGTSSAAG